MQSILNIAISSNFKNCISSFCVQSSKCSKRAKFKSKAWTFYCFSLLLRRINWFCRVWVYTRQKPMIYYPPKILLWKKYIFTFVQKIFFQSKINRSLEFKSNSGSFSILLQNFWSLVDGGIPTDRVKSNVNIVYAFPPRKIENMKHLRIENKFCQTKHNQIVNVYCSHLSSSLCQHLNA